MKHTIIFAGAGILMGLLTSLVGLPAMVEYSAWAGLYLLLMVLGLKLAVPTPVRTLGFASTLAGLLTGSTQVILMEHYRANNPWYASEFETSTAADLSTAFLVQGIIFGLACGLLVGLAVRWRQAKSQA